jgi:hypothetical protein
MPDSVSAHETIADRIFGSDNRSDARYSCWLSAGTVQARSAALHSLAVTSQVFSCNVPAARPHRHAHPYFSVNPSPQSLQSKRRTSDPAPPAEPPTAISCHYFGPD